MNNLRAFRLFLKTHVTPFSVLEEQFWHVPSGWAGWAGLTLTILFSSYVCFLERWQAFRLFVKTEVELFVGM